MCCGAVRADFKYGVCCNWLRRASARACSRPSPLIRRSPPLSKPLGPVWCMRVVLAWQAIGEYAGSVPEAMRWMPACFGAGMGVLSALALSIAVFPEVWTSLGKSGVDFKIASSKCSSLFFVRVHIHILTLACCSATACTCLMWGLHFLRKFMA
jgi:hypothetical protein